MKAALTRKLWSLIGRVSIQVKIMGIIILVVLALGLALTWYIKGSLAPSLEQELGSRGLAIGNNVATHAADLMLTDNLYDLFRIIEGALQSDKEVRYIYIVDTSSKVLLHSFGDGFPSDLLRINKPERDLASILAFDSQEERLLDVAIPVLGGELGSVHVGISTQGVNQAMARHIRYVLTAMAIVLLPGLFLAFLLANIITRAIRGVVRAAEAVGKGDFSQKARVWAQDEIGVLGKAFNEMVERLRITHLQLRSSHSNLSILYTSAKASSQSLTLEEIIMKTLEQVCPSLSLSEGRVCLLPAKGSSLSFEYEHSIHPTLRRYQVSSPHSCPCIEKLNSRAYMVEFGAFLCPLREGKSLGAFNPNHWAICLHLRAKDKLIGVLHFRRDGGNTFEREEIELLQGVSEQLAISVENALLLEELQEKEATKGYLLQRVITAQEEERRRIARELHDETSPALSSLAMGLKAIQESPTLPDALARATALHQMATLALQGVHGLARDIRLNLVDELGLAAAVRHYLEKFSRDTQMAVDVHIGSEAMGRFPGEVATAVFRIIQEALTNVAKHAKATRVSLIMECRGSSLIVVVEDNGIGFNMAQLPAEPDPERLGLHGMMERANLIEAKLSVESERGAGCAVYLEVPLAREGVKG